MAVSNTAALMAVSRLVQASMVFAVALAGDKTIRNSLVTIPLAALLPGYAKTAPSLVNTLGKTANA